MVSSTRRTKMTDKEYEHILKTLLDFQSESEVELCSQQNEIRTTMDIAGLRRHHIDGHYVSKRNRC
jgi:hypothetical protein